MKTIYNEYEALNQEGHELEERNLDSFQKFFSELVADCKAHDLSLREVCMFYQQDIGVRFAEEILRTAMAKRKMERIKNENQSSNNS